MNIDVECVLSAAVGTAISILLSSIFTCFIDILCTCFYKQNNNNDDDDDDDGMGATVLQTSNKKYIDSL